jgi:hypothetical protein
MPRIGLTVFIEANPAGIQFIGSEDCSDIAGHL